MELADTEQRARRVHRASLASRSPAERVVMAVEMSEQVREVARSGIRYRHRDWTEEQVKWELLACLYGRDVVSEIRTQRGLED